MALVCSSVLCVGVFAIPSIGCTMARRLSENNHTLGYRETCFANGYYLGAGSSVGRIWSARVSYWASIVARMKIGLRSRKMSFEPGADCRIQESVMCFCQMSRPEQSCLYVWRDAAVEGSDESMRPIGCNLQSGGISNGHGGLFFEDSSASPRSNCYLQSWFRFACCTVAAIALYVPLRLEPVSISAGLANPDCKDEFGYYAPLSGLDGQDLRSRIHSVIKDHHALSYIQVWDALKVLDEAEDDADSVVEIYSLKKIAKGLQGRTDGWNREHLWPRSYGLLMGRPEFTDLHNLRPADVNVNSSRGNKVFGQCTVSLKDQCLVPANKEAAPDTGTNKNIWMPPAQVRGDIARALMYMAVRYGSGQPAGSLELQLSDSPFVGQAQMGLLSDLLQWNERDPPSEAEKVRNVRVCALYQHNRNPFVDHPEYGSLIWGVLEAPTADPPYTLAEPLIDSILVDK